MKMPIADVRKIHRSKSGNYESFAIFLPKVYATTLEAIGVNEFLVVFNSFGGILVPVKNKQEIEKMKVHVLKMLPKIADLVDYERHED